MPVATGARLRSRAPVLTVFSSSRVTAACGDVPQASKSYSVRATTFGVRSLEQAKRFFADRGVKTIPGDAPHSIALPAEANLGLSEAPRTRRQAKAISPSDELARGRHRRMTGFREDP